MARVGIDLDGVCYDFADALKRYLETHPGWNNVDFFDFPDPVRWEFYEDWGLTLDQFVNHCNHGVDAGVIFRTGEPTEDAAAQLRRLKDAGHTVHILTDRSFGTKSRSNTLAWLHEHMIPYDTIDFTADKTSVPTDYMIDDKPENYVQLMNAGCQVFLMDRPWNRLAGFVSVRTKSLEAFVDYVLADAAVADRRSTRPTLPENWELASLPGEVRSTSSTGGQKGVKPQRFDLIPAHPLTLLAEHYGAGALKYDDHQWRKGYEWSKSFAAMQRHAWLWWNGEDTDVETGSNHLTAVAWHAFALLQYAQDHPDFDDRPR